MRITRRGFLKKGAMATLGASAAASSRGHSAGPFAEQAAVTWWILADPHVGYPGYKENLLTSVRDINHLQKIDRALIIGDLFEDDRAFLDPFKRELGALHCEWSYILGNHDYDKNSEAPILPVNYFSSQHHGLRIIALSDEMLERDHHRTELGRNQDRWFRDVLREDPDIPTVLITHHCPVTGRRSVSSFDHWLKEELCDYRVVLWIVGHAHRWAIDTNLEGLGFDRIKVGSICEKHGDRRACESALLRIEDLGDETGISMRFRNHENREWLTVAGYESYVLRVKKRLVRN